MRLLTAAATVLALLLLPAVAGAAWSQPGYGAAHLFSSPIDGPLDPANIGQAEQKWAWEAPGGTGDQAEGPVLVVYGMAVFEVGQRSLVALDARTGAPAWEADLGPDGGRITAQGRTVYAAAGGRLLTFPARCRTDGGTCSPRVMAEGGYRLPTIAHDRVLATRFDGEREDLVAFDRACLRACEPVWEHRPPRGQELSFPSARAGIAWVGTSTGRLLGFPLDCTPVDGQCAPVRRGVAAGVSFERGAPSVGSRRVYALSDPGRIYAFPAGCVETCGPAWRSQGAEYEQPAVTSARVWAVRDDPNGDGALLHEYSPVCRPPASGQCSPRSSPRLRDEDGTPITAPTGPNLTAADEMLFFAVGGAGPRQGVAVYRRTRDGSVGAPLARFGSQSLRGQATVSGGMVYFVEGPAGGTSTVRAFGLPGAAPAAR